MKRLNLLWMCICSCAIYTAGAQENNVSTTVLKLQELITHAADAYPADEGVQLLLLVEVPEGGFGLDERFYLEQGIGLLTNRLEEDDKIALATYGSAHGVIMPYTGLANEQSIREHTAALLENKISLKQGDGINEAYQYATDYLDDDVLNRVVMVRSGVRTSMAAVSASANVARTPNVQTERSQEKEKQRTTATHPSVGGAIAITALSILPEVLQVIKD